MGLGGEGRTARAVETAHCTTVRLGSRQGCCWVAASATWVAPVPHPLGSTRSTSSGTRSSCSCSPCCGARRPRAGCPPAAAAGHGSMGSAETGSASPGGRRRAGATCSMHAGASARVQRRRQRRQHNRLYNGLKRAARKRRTPPAILGRKALGLRSRMASTADCTVEEERKTQRKTKGEGSDRRSAGRRTLAAGSAAVLAQPQHAGSTRPRAPSSHSPQAHLPRRLVLPVVVAVEAVAAVAVAARGKALAVAALGCWFGAGGGSQANARSGAGFEGAPDCKACKQA